MANQVLTPEQMTDPNTVLAFMFAGDATLTFRSVKSGNRYTFRIQGGEKKDKIAPYFVKLLVGSDNENDYAYMGMISFYQGKWNFRLTPASAKSNFTENSTTVKAFRWTFQPLLEGRMPMGVEIWHEGRCARCHRKLTNPEQPGYVHPGHGSRHLYPSFCNVGWSSRRISTRSARIHSNMGFLYCGSGNPPFEARMLFAINHE